MWVGLSVAGEGPGILGAMLVPGLVVAHELRIPVLQVSGGGSQRGAQELWGVCVCVSVCLSVCLFVCVCSLSLRGRMTLVGLGWTVTLWANR